MSLTQSIGTIRLIPPKGRWCGVTHYPMCSDCNRVPQFPPTAPFIMTVGLQFLSNRSCIITGSILLTSAFIITSQATDIYILFLSIGFLEGWYLFFKPPSNILKKLCRINMEIC